jgi:hypothetical protein
LIGINVTNTYLLANYHQVINLTKFGAGEEKEKQIGIQRFAGILAQQLIEMSKKIPQGDARLRFRPEETLNVITITSATATADFSLPTIDSSLQGKRILQSLQDANGMYHHLGKYDVTLNPGGRKRTKMRKCKLCLANGKCCDVGQYCVTCGESFSLCNKIDDKENDCFLKHVKAVKRITWQTNKNAAVP